MNEDPVVRAEQDYDLQHSNFERHWEQYESSAQYTEDLENEFSKLIKDSDSCWEAWGYEGFHAYAPQDRLEKIESDLMEAVIEQNFDYLGRFLCSQCTHYFLSHAQDNLRDNYDYITH
jgi:hypothetical protein